MGASREDYPRTAGSVQPTRWTLRRTFSFALIISGAIWLVIGLAIRFLVY